MIQENTSAPLLLLELAHRARHAGSTEELAFIAVNDSHGLHAYRQAALWFAQRGIRALSGVVQPEANAPYALWLSRVCRHLHATCSQATLVTSAQLPADLAAEWHEWLPAFGLWLPLQDADNNPAGNGGLLLVAEQPWPENSVALMCEWVDIWQHAWRARHKPTLSWMRFRHSNTVATRHWWQHHSLKIAIVILALLMIPVHLSILVPGELAPINPVVIRAPLDGVIGQIHVHPNETVTSGQPLFSFDEATIASRLEVATQTMVTAQAEYRQFAQQAVSDNKSRAQLSGLLGKIEEKRTEADYMQEQLHRSRVTASRAGVVLFDDPSEWVGKPVQTGERIMRIATPGDVEVEAWIPVGDAIPLDVGAQVQLYLAANPLSAVSARVRYVAYDAQLRPEGHFAYRLRATLEAPTQQRVGLKGTAKISGDWVPLAYWMLRRPLATIRQTLGL